MILISSNDRKSTIKDVTKDSWNKNKVTVESILKASEQKNDFPKNPPALNSIPIKVHASGEEEQLLLLLWLHLL